MGDAQTHALPADELQRERVARGLGHADMSVLDTELAGVRSYVASEFAGLLAPRKAVSGDSDLSLYWRSLPDDGEASSLASAGFEAGDDLHRSLCDFARAPGVRELSDATRARLDRVLPALLQAAANSSQPDAALRRLWPLLHTRLKRASYLALLLSLIHI